MKSSLPRRFRPSLEALESRWVPSASTLNVPAAAETAAAIGHAHADNQVMQFKESLTITHVSDGVYTYEGHATHLGKVTAFSFPDGSFTKIAANGDQIFGQLYPATATTGSMTFSGGTGRFAHVSGSASYVLSMGPTATGVTHVTVVGTLAHVLNGDLGDSHSQHALPFAVTGGSPAPQPLALAPYVLTPHSATGTASFLGQYTGSGVFQHDPLVIDPATGVVTANFQGTFTFVAANGDKLVTHYGTGYTGKLVGQLSADGSTIVSVQFDAIFTIDGAQSTGRFAGASGSWRMIANASNISLAGMVVNNIPYTAPFDYTWTGGGTITFADRDK
jgi:hypothetical protein